MIRKIQFLLPWLRLWQGRENKMKRCQDTCILKQSSSCLPLTQFLRRSEESFLEAYVCLHVKRKLKLLVMAVTIPWFQMPLLGESHLYISNFKSFLNRALACVAVYQPGMGITLTVSVLTSRNFLFALVSPHQPKHCQLRPVSSFRVISSILRTVNWVPLSPGAC